MAVIVRIASLKSIKTLEFDVPLNGAFVITGANGCGKTSLLTVLHRMGARNAFQTGLPGGQISTGIDSINNTVIEYEIHGRTVSYRYNKERWSATPKSNSGLISEAFREVLFLKADSSRVEPTPNELKGLRKQPANPDLRAFMNAVFDTTKFTNLHQIRLRGRNATAHLIDCSQPGDRKKTYYSEKAFSLGELCVMRLGQKLLSMITGGLYIIDEFEMALHPAAQIRLFAQIERLARERNCTALVSTHSSSLIKTLGRGKIIYLENELGEVTIHRNVYPTYALQHLSLDEENAPDKLILVEDVSARSCVDELWRQHIRSQLAAGVRVLPNVQIAVIGGYKEVLRFLGRSASFVPALTRRIAALDADAEPVCLPPAAAAGQPIPALSIPQQLYAAQRGDVIFLPWTPEVGFCELLRADLATHRTAIRNLTGVLNLPITQAQANAHAGLANRPLRDACKRTVDEIALAISQRNGYSEERAREILLGYLVQVSIAQDSALMRGLAGRLFG